MDNIQEIATKYHELKAVRVAAKNAEMAHVHETLPIVAALALEHAKKHDGDVKRYQKYLKGDSVGRWDIEDAYQMCLLELGKKITK